MPYSYKSRCLTEFLRSGRHTMDSNIRCAQAARQRNRSLSVASCSEASQPQMHAGCGVRPVLPWRYPCSRDAEVASTLELLKVPVSSLDTGVASTPTRDAVLSVSSHFSRRQDKLLRRHTGKPGSVAKNILSVPEDAICSWQ
jgi:hypothetical protein